MTRLEAASFEVERFELSGDSSLEVRGRWFGVRGRRFMRPALTAVTDGREQRMLAVLDHKPWVAEEGEPWRAVFPCESDPGAMDRAELTVAPDVTVPLPSPSRQVRGRRERPAASRTRKTSAAKTTRAAEDGDAASDLKALEEDRDRLRVAHDRVSRQLDAAVAKHDEEIEAEVERRIANLRVEVERERAGAGLAARMARERDQARAARDEAAKERDEAAGERDEAREQRDTAHQQRNRMLAERDSARSRVLEATRQWELTAAVGTRRTLERDAIATERDRLARERDAAVAASEQIAAERDAALEALDRMTDGRDGALQTRDRMAEERDAALEMRDRVGEERDAALQTLEGTVAERDAALQARELIAEERDGAAQTPGHLDAGLKDAGVPPDVPTLVLDDGPASEEPQATEELQATSTDGPSTTDAPGAVERAVPRPRLPPRPSGEPRIAEPRGAGISDWRQGPLDPLALLEEAGDVWRKRLLAISALLVAAVVMLVLLLAH
ncbi:MAG TPA: hypothetical protein VF927_11370 [Solirubrobacteraceae bacterium]